MKKPRVRWRAVWRHRWILLDLINQIAYGTEAECIEMVHRYSGSEYVGMKVYIAARDIIETEET